MEQNDATHAATVIAFAALAKAVMEHLPAEDAETFALTITAELQAQSERSDQPKPIADRLQEYAYAVEAIPLPD